jgi:hypothetical protein
MNFRGIFLSAALGALALSAAPSAVAEDLEKAATEGRVVVVGDGVARFHVTTDSKAGVAMLRLSDPAVKITSDPVVVVKTDSGPKEVRLVAVDGRPGTWRLEHEMLRGARFEGTMKVVVADKPYEAPLLIEATTLEPGVMPEPGTTTTKFVARRGGFVVAFPDCAAHVEAVLDRDTGTITIWSLDETVKIVDAPTVIVTEKSSPQTLTLVKVEGETMGWRLQNAVFKSTTFSGKLRLMVNGKACDAPLSLAPHGGRIITVAGGPRFEVVPDPEGRSYTFYAIDETIDGKAYAIDTPPQVVWDTPEGPRTVTLVPVEREPRAWRLVWADASLRRPADARLRFTLFGKTLEGNFGLSGVGVGVR